MQSRLIVKNFGPIREADLDLRNVNVFIGPQASGKSAIAKLFTIFKTPRKFIKNGNGEQLKQFHETLKEYNILSFLTEESHIEYHSPIHLLKYSSGALTYEPYLKNQIDKLSNEIESSNEDNSIAHIIKKEIELLQNNYHNISPFYHEININSSSVSEVWGQFRAVVAAARLLEEGLSTQSIVYIPAERMFINLLLGSVSNLLLNNVPIPKHILLFGAEIEKSPIKEIDLNFLDLNNSNSTGIVYKNNNGDRRIFLNETLSLQLTEAASGIQSVIPLLIPILSNTTAAQNRSFVIEESELNLFPTAQYELIKLLESIRPESLKYDTGACHVYTTHSPYILSAMNILLYASKIYNKFGHSSSEYSEEKLSQLSSIIPPRSNLQPDIFAAYQIQGGHAESIFNRETGLIDDNYIDDASDKMNDDLDALMNLMR
jgi:hypothetical protein